MKIKLLLITLLLSITTINAAPFKNVKKILTQPDGTELHCFASGDEFYNRLHDNEGYTIVQAENGYFVYATTNASGEIIATQHIAGKSDPKSLGLTPHIMIPQEEYLKRRSKMEVSKNRDLSGLNHGIYNNIVVFIKFNGDSDFRTTQTEIDSMFNYNGYYDISMNNYFKKATYNQLAMNSYCYPKADGDKVLAYEDIYPRKYYMPYNEKTNPDGYKEEENERGEREFALLKRAIEYIADEVPDTLNIDRNEDGLVDNVIFVVKGNVGDWSDLLWPHMWELHGEEAYIHNKRVLGFNFQLETSTYFTVSTLCHEMAHSLGFPDLYHYEPRYDYLSPTGPWDLMCNNSQPPQHTGTYMKYKYGTWIEEIPEIGYGTYTIEANSWEGGRRNCYKIPTSDPNQFYLVEYRNKDNIFEKGLPEGGLLIYRLDTRYNGCIHYNGKNILDELYIFRPGGTHNSDGKINMAAFHADQNKTEFNKNTDPRPFLNLNVKDDNINICNISARGDKMTFSYLPANSDIIPSNFIANVNKNDKVVELKWNTVENATSYNVYRDGKVIADNITDNSYVDEYQNIENGHHTYFVTSNTNGEESFHSNEENVIVGDYREYVFDMNCSGDNGWQGGEITLSFNNGMEDRYLTMYSDHNKKESVVVPTGTEISVTWTAGWDDTECSFTIIDGDNEIYKSEKLEEGLLTTINVEGEKSGCVQPENLTASVSGIYVDLNWSSSVENDSYIIMRNNEIIAEDITSNFYTDKTAITSGTYNYAVMSKNNGCTSLPSNHVIATILKYSQDIIDANATFVDEGVKLKWNISSNESNTLNYDDGKYVTSVGSSSNTWGIRVPAECLSIYEGAKITAIEIFDAAACSYNFNIYNGDTPSNSNVIHNETFKTTKTNDFVTFNLSKEVSFDFNQDLWLTAKASTSSDKPIPCGNFVETANSNMIKVGTAWKSASEYDMNYSWLIRLHIEQSESFANELSYNIYKENTLIASDLKSMTYTDTDKKNTGESICYNIDVIYKDVVILCSEDVCPTTETGLTTEENNTLNLYPNPTSDYVKITGNNINNVKIYSLIGGVIFEEDTYCDELQIDMREFGKGIYLIQVATDTETRTHKVAVY